VLSNLELGRMLCDLLVYNDGLLVLRESRWVLIRRQLAGLFGMGRQSDRKRVQARTDRPVTELRILPRSRWIPLSELTGGQYARRRTITSIHLHLASGEDVRLKISNFTVEYADTHQTLRALFESLTEPKVTASARP
jgi:hypothetical protein